MQQYRQMYMAVGVLVVVFLCGMLFLTFKGSDSSLFSNRDVFGLYAKFDQVSGLHVNSPVRIAGVQVGRVTHIALDAKTYQARVDMSFNQDIAIPVDSSAVIYTDGLLGSKYISIQVGYEHQALADGARIEQTSSGVVLEEFLASAVNMLRKKDD